MNGGLLARLTHRRMMLECSLALLSLSLSFSLSVSLSLSLSLSLSCPLLSFCDAPSRSLARSLAQFVSMNIELLGLYFHSSAVLTTKICVFIFSMY